MTWGRRARRQDRELRRAKAHYRLLRGRVEAVARGAAIAALPAVEWRGRTLRTVVCQADFGVGPHPMNVPESILWELFDLRAFRCPWHL